MSFVLHLRIAFCRTVGMLNKSIMQPAASIQTLQSEWHSESQVKSAAASAALPLPSAAPSTTHRKKTWPDERGYEGEWKDNKKKGRGKETWPNGQVYEGEYKESKRHGQGTMTYADGRRESGTWRNGAFVG
jgi:hypothetical protein